MRYNILGHTGLFVSELCLGTMTFGGGSGIYSSMGGLQQGDADGLLKTAIDAGINFIDTSDVYSKGLSEQITGEALRNAGIAREDVIVATKFFGPTGDGPNARGTSRSHLLYALEASLKRLQVDHIDLYQIHGFDQITPMEETLRALETVVQQGKVRYIGVSNWAAWQIAKAVGISNQFNLSRFASLQAHYTIAGRDLERELVPMVESEGIGLMVWSPLAGGFLSGKYSRDGAKDGDNRRATFDFPPVNEERGYDVIDAMKPIAEAKCVSIAQIALAWLLHQKAVTSVVIGAKKPEQLDDNLAATKVALTDAELSTLDEVSKLPGEYPGWVFEFQSKVRGDQLKREPRGA
ncbi:aldo/keto reductase [Sphingomonas ginsenosidivorax]|uniref:Aldo/keto reductase n=1 Tax=Sphingomonas ginsenosidivorax TaxID=862135 RepID=A0A5C6UGP0_9SPHN|nr:aldo/keto reductase [Sphingomonas ginsenosidivorax]TXC71346.1 aldo/keto reductase [Sphingomonas ginsenosidivorax]